MIKASRVWRSQRGNQNPYIEEEQTTQWPKEKVQKDKQRSTKHTYKTKDRVTRTPLKTGDELRCPGMVGSSCSTSITRRGNLVKSVWFLHWFSVLHEHGLRCSVARDSTVVSIKKTRDDSDGNIKDYIWETGKQRKERTIRTKSDRDIMSCVIDPCHTNFILLEK